MSWNGVAGLDIGDASLDMGPQGRGLQGQALGRTAGHGSSWLGLGAQSWVLRRGVGLGGEGLGIGAQG